MSLRGITTITLKEDAFFGFGIKFVLSKSKNMNKASTTKNTRRKEMRNLIM